MITKFLDQQQNKNISKSDIINQELKIDLNDESINHPQLELEIEEDVKQTLKTDQLQPNSKEVQTKAEKIDTQEKSEEKPKPYTIFDF